MTKPVIQIIDELDKVQDEASFDVGTNIADAAMGRWPDGFPGQTVIPLDASGIPITPENAVTNTMREGEVYQIVLRPQFDPVTWTAIFTTTIGASSVTWFSVAVGVLSLLGSFLLAPKLPTLGGQYEWDDSDRPQFLSGQQNKFTPGSRVYELFGRSRVYPSLIAEPWVRYVGDSQTIDELYVVTNGYAEVEGLRLSDEPLSSIGAFSYKVYHPGDAWPVGFPIVVPNDFVTGGNIELPGPNERPVVSATFTFDVAGSYIEEDTDEFFSDIDIGSKYQVSGATNANNNQIYTVVSVTEVGKRLNVTPAPGTNEVNSSGDINFNQVINEAGPYNGPWIYDGFQNQYIDAVDPGFTGIAVDVATGNEIIGVDYGDYNMTQDGGGSEWNRDNFYGIFLATFPVPFLWVEFATQGWNPQAPGAGTSTTTFTIPGATKEVHFDIEFPSGLYKQTGGSVPAQRAVNVSIFYRLIGDTVWLEKSFKYTGLTRTPRRFTSVVNWVDEGQPNGRYECYFSRTTDWIPDTGSAITVDACRLIGMRGNQVLDGSFGAPDLTTDVLETTIVWLSISAQNAQVITSNRSFNLIGDRFLPDWATGDGSTLKSDSSIRSAMLYTLLGNYGAGSQVDITKIDIPALNAIHSDMLAVAPATAQFNGIVDQTMTVEDQLMLIANVGRIIVYRRASNIYFERLKADLVPITLINSRVKLSPESKTMNFSMTNEPDAIIARFADRDNEWKEESVQYPANVVPVNPSEQTFLGITDKTEAMRQVQYLWDKRKYERDLMTADVTNDAVLWGPGQVVAVTDHLTYEKPIDGEVVEVLAAGGSVRLDQPIPDGTYIARLRDRLGDLHSETQVTISGGEDGTVLIAAWDAALAPTEATAQVGMLYSFTPVTDADGDLYYITNVSPSRDGPVQVSLVRYDDATYQSDTDVIVFNKAVKHGN